tara:strand:+ start:582 stop:1400 length:819 start_codon:yes stop_codon:yes gene_type:complete
LFKKIIYKNKFLFKILKAYWITIYLLKIIINKDNFYKLTKSQHNDEENKYLETLIPYVKNRNFIEIGFHFRQFNTINLIKNNFEGKLVDTSKYDLLNIIFSKFVIKILKKKVQIIDLFISPKNINNIIKENSLGFLSLDIDGNDYWVLLEILKKKFFPEVIIVEYNASFLKHSITIPYIENFNLYTHHSSHCYHGASLTAFNKLLSKYNYTLIRSIAGVNAIFVKDSVFNRINAKKIDPNDVNQECESRNKKLNNTSKDQYNLIKHLPFIEV